MQRYNSAVITLNIHLENYILKLSSLLCSKKNTTVISVTFEIHSKSV